MSDLAARLGFPPRDDETYYTVVVLLNEQLEELLKSGYHDPVPDDSLLPPVRAGSLSELDRDSVNALKAALPGRLDDHPVPGLLVSAFENKDDLDDKSIQLVAKSTHLGILLTDMGEEYNAHVVHACRRARLLITRDRHLLPHIPSFRQSFSKIAKELESLKERPPKEINVHDLQLDDWIRSFTTYITDRRMYKRHSFGSDVASDGEAIQHPVPDDGDVELMVSEPAVTVPFPNSPEEARDDQPKVGKAIRPLVESTPQDRSRGMAFNRANEIVNRLCRDSSGAPCLTSRLTEFQVRRSFELCYQHLGTLPAHLMVAISILTGRGVERLLSLELCRKSKTGGAGEYWIVESNRVYLRYEPDLPEHKKITSLKGIDRMSDNSVRLAVPRRISKSLLALYGNNRHLRQKIDISPVVSKLAKDIDKSITSTRLMSAFSHALNAEGVDEVLIAWLTGGSPKHNAGMYYTLLSRTDASEAHAEFVDSLLAFAGLKERLPRHESNEYVGTRIRINPAFITRTFRL